MNASVDRGFAITGTRQLRVRDCGLKDNLENVFISLPSPVAS